MPLQRMDTKHCRSIRRPSSRERTRDGRCKTSPGRPMSWACATLVGVVALSLTTSGKYTKLEIFEIELIFLCNIFWMLPRAISEELQPERGGKVSERIMSPASSAKAGSFVLRYRKEARSMTFGARVSNGPTNPATWRGKLNSWAPERVIKSEFSRASKDYWSKLVPSTGRPNSSALSKPDQWGGV